MPRSKKNKNADNKIPNYSKYKYSETLPHFAEKDRLLENELNSLKCYEEYQLEAPLNSFNNDKLNDHLYLTYLKRISETAGFMQKWVSFFVCQHHTKLTLGVQDY